MADKSGGNEDDDGAALEKQTEILMPRAVISRIMRKALPPNAKVSKEAIEAMQTCLTEFIAFVTSEASCKTDKAMRKTVTGDDICSAMYTLGFDHCAELAARCQERYKESEEDLLNRARRGLDGIDKGSHHVSSSATGGDSNRSYPS